jgi:hypothetical protein
MKRFVFAILIATLLFSCAPPEKRIVTTVFYPPPPVQPRLQFLLSITTEEDIEKRYSAFEAFLIGKKPLMKKIAGPYDIGAVKGKIYISDRSFKKILIIDLEKKEFDYIRDEGMGALLDPAGMWVTEDDIKYVADMERKQIVVFGRDNKFLRAYGKKDQFDKPTDVAVYKDKVYVCDHKKHEIIVLDKDTGKTIQTIGGEGIEEGKMYRPTHVIVDHEGNIYVNDNFNFRMQMFNPEGNFLKSFGFLGDTFGAFARPKGLDIDRDRHLYVVDAAFENVQIFDVNTTQLLLFFGGFGAEYGSMYLPSGIYIDYYNVEYFQKYADKDFKIKYLVYVGNMYGRHRLNVYGFGDWIGAPLPGMEDEKVEETGEQEKTK